MSKGQSQYKRKTKQEKQATAKSVDQEHETESEDLQEQTQEQIDSAFAEATKSSKPIPSFWFDSYRMNNEGGPKRFRNPRESGCAQAKQRFPSIPYPPPKEGDSLQKRYPFLTILASKEIEYPEVTVQLLKAYLGSSHLQSIMRFDAQEIVDSGHVSFEQMAEWMHQVNPAAEYVHEFGLVDPYTEGMRVMYRVWKDNPDPTKRKLIESYVELRDTYSGEAPVIEERAAMDMAELTRLSKQDVMTLSSCMCMPPMSPTEDVSLWRTALHSHVMGLTKTEYNKGLIVFTRLKKKGK